MNIKDILKRWFYALKNGDPVRSCPVFQNRYCGVVDDPYCKMSDCRILDEYMGEKWVGCARCIYQESCCSKNFGLGCIEGKILEEEKEEIE